MQLRLLDSAVLRVDAVHSPVGQRQLPAAAPSLVRDVATHARFWRPLPRKVVDIVCGDVAAAEVSFHAHEALQVLLPTSPFVVISAAGRETLVYPGVVHVTSPLELRAARSLDGAPFTARVMLLSPAVLATRSAAVASGPRATAAQSADATPSFTELTVDDGDLYAELMSVFDALRRPVVALQCESRLLECVTRLVARRGESAARKAGPQIPGGVVRARDYLRARAVENLTLDELAKVAGLSKFYLLRAFYRAYGLTPHAYQMQLRLARARRLLADGRPLSHVTYDAGFADQSHLTRRFAAFYGLTPARFARQLTTPAGAAPEPRATRSLTATPPSAA
jgi:AraC-like DNA-binding protein